MKRAHVYWLVGLLLLVAGCSKGPAVVSLTGQVTLNGLPLEDGDIRFVPKDGKGATAGAVIEKGKYEAKVTPGPKTVHINAFKVVGEHVLFEGIPESPTAPIKTTIAEMSFDYEVKESGNKDFELKSQK